MRRKSQRCYKYTGVFITKTPRMPSLLISIWERSREAAWEKLKLDMETIQRYGHAKCKYELQTIYLSPEENNV